MLWAAASPPRAAPARWSGARQCWSLWEPLAEKMPGIFFFRLEESREERRPGGIGNRRQEVCEEGVEPPGGTAASQAAGQGEPGRVGTPQGRLHTRQERDAALPLPSSTPKPSTLLLTVPQR